MTEDTPLPFDLPAVHRKKITVDFNGGNQSSNAGLLLLREAERKRSAGLSTPIRLPIPFFLKSFATASGRIS
jgi:hypothetical protein